VVVFDYTDLGACVAATEAGIPAVSHGITMPSEPFRAGLLEHTPRLWRKAGFDTPPFELPPGELFLDIWPDDLPAGPPSASTAERARLRPVAWSDPASGVPTWVTEPHERPFVFVSLGTIQFEMAELLDRVIEGLRAVDVDALVLSGVGVEPSQLRHTDRIRAAGFVHQVGVLDRSDLVIHHAGAGTMLGALERGLPSLAVAAGADRPVNAMSLAASGAGLSLDPATATPTQIADAVRRLLDEPSFRQAAERVRSTIEDMPSPDETVTRLEEWVAARPRR
jgi:UDP:flavonoid glycosyltransferase YjiC (YdhE family)